MVEIHHWLAEPMPKDVRRALEQLATREDVQHIAVMPDVHLAHEVCIGTVLATSRLLYPQAVGGDIGCGMSALRLDAHAELLRDETRAARVLAALQQAVPIARQPARQELALGEPCELSDGSLQRLAERDGRVELGTLGRGNHFLELQADAEDSLWLMVHSGSRAMGQAIRDHHLRQGRAFAADTPAGQAYQNDVGWALRYARANRQAIASAVAALMNELFGVEAMPATSFDCHHNSVARETHSGRELLVHRKGANRAGAGELGIIPGSMGARSFHVEGRGAAQSLCSSSHGAGRRLARGVAMREISRGDLLREMRGVCFDHRRADRLRDEAPSAYKDIGAVMRAQRDLVRIVRELRPLLSYKAA